MSIEITREEAARLSAFLKELSEQGDTFYEEQAEICKSWVARLGGRLAPAPVDPWVEFRGRVLHRMHTLVQSEAIADETEADARAVHERLVDAVDWERVAEACIDANDDAGTVSIEGQLGPITDPRPAMDAAKREVLRQLGAGSGGSGDREDLRRAVENADRPPVPPTKADEVQALVNANLTAPTPHPASMGDRIDQCRATVDDWIADYGHCEWKHLNDLPPSIRNALAKAFAAAIDAEVGKVERERNEAQESVREEASKFDTAQERLDRLRDALRKRAGLPTYNFGAVTDEDLVRAALAAAIAERDEARQRALINEGKYRLALGERDEARAALADAQTAFTKTGDHFAWQRARADLVRERDEARTEVERVTRAYDGQYTRSTELSAEVARYREALEFYADDGNHRSAPVTLPADEHDERTVHAASKVLRDFGAKARRALDGTGEIECNYLEDDAELARFLARYIRGGVLEYQDTKMRAIIERWVRIRMGREPMPKLDESVALGPNATGADCLAPVPDPTPHPTSVGERIVGAFRGRDDIRARNLGRDLFHVPGVTWRDLAAAIDAEVGEAIAQRDEARELARTHELNHESCLQELERERKIRRKVAEESYAAAKDRDEARAEVERLNRALAIEQEKGHKAAESYRATITRYREALEFYADERIFDCDGDVPGGGDDCPIDGDRGQFARRALDGTGEAGDREAEQESIDRGDTETAKAERQHDSLDSPTPASPIRRVLDAAGNWYDGECNDPEGPDQPAHKARLENALDDLPAALAELDALERIAEKAEGVPDLWSKVRDGIADLAPGQRIPEGTGRNMDWLMPQRIAALAAALRERGE